VNRVVAARNGVGEGQGDSIQFPVAHTHPPDEVVDIVNVLLVGFGGEDNDAAPGATARSDPFVIEKDCELFHDDFTFMWAIIGLGAANGLALASVNYKFESTNTFGHASFIEGIPVLLNKHGQFAFCFLVDIIANAEVFGEFRCVSSWVPCTNVIARGELTEQWSLSEARAILLEGEDAIVKVVIKVIGLVFVCWFGAPDFGGYLDAEADCGVGQSMVELGVTWAGCDSEMSSGYGSCKRMLVPVEIE
jgi:hypothetical protein